MMKVLDFLSFLVFNLVRWDFFCCDFHCSIHSHYYSILLSISTRLHFTISIIYARIKWIPRDIWKTHRNHEIIKTAFLFYQCHHHQLVCFSNFLQNQFWIKQMLMDLDIKVRKKPKHLNNSQSLQLAVHPNKPSIHFA